MTDQIVAYVRTLSPDMASGCELTVMDRAAIDMEIAAHQHESYANARSLAGAGVTILPALNGHPDCAFIEDTLVCLPEVVIAMRPGVASREAEGAATIGQLDRQRESASIDTPGTMEGGDILRVGKRLYVGQSTRTRRSDDEGIALKDSCDVCHPRRSGRQPTMG